MSDQGRRWWIRGVKWLGSWRGLGAIAALGAIAVIGGWTAAHLVPLPERLNYADSVVVTYSDGRPAHILLSDDEQWRLPTQIEAVDPAYLKALIALEDGRFYTHPGVDPVAIARASIDNLKTGSVVSGASTITMQLVRLLEPRPRTLRSKIAEALRAIQLEIHMSKEEILQAYLRFIPFGGNMEGIEAATLSFWDRSPSGLSGAEIATLLAIPQSPNARRPAVDNRDALRGARDEIAHRLDDVDAIPGAGRRESLKRQLEDSPVPVNTHRLPQEVPHVVQWLKTHRPQAFERDEAGRGEPSIRIETTLDRFVQRQIGAIVADHERRLRATGAPHAAVVVMESETGKLRGIVGNLGYDTAIPGSYLPAFATPRSTGSLLKPVVYAAALDEGIVAPTHTLLDVPIVRGDYRPQNFDRQFRGLVEAEEALAKSLNIPFVHLLEQLGVDDFIQTMMRFEMEGALRRSGHGGLELVIGGMPASALEMASLYGGFARGGRPVRPEIYDVEGREVTPVADDEVASELYEMLVGVGLQPPLISRDSDTATGEERAISEASAWLTTRALMRRPTPWSELGSRRPRDAGLIWKTGTSFAYHDAWTAGFGETYTVVVWAGDLGFRRHPELVGAQVAAPVFFDVVETIDEPFDLRDARPHEALTDIEVCARSGRRATERCEFRNTAQAPAMSAAPARCEMHVEIDVDRSTGWRLPAGCRPDGVDVVSRIAERLPDPVARFERARGRRTGGLPQIHPECRSEDRATLSIASPQQGTTVVLESHRPADRQVVRLEAYSSVGSQIHWYISGRYLESALDGEAVYWVPEPGEWTVSAVDDRGLRDTRELVVEGQAGPAQDNDGRDQ